jgi:hypothetical protein
MEARRRYKNQLGSKVFPRPGPKLTGPRPLKKQKTSENNDNAAGEMPAETVPALPTRSTPRIDFIQRNIDRASTSRSRQRIQPTVSKKELLVNAVHQRGEIPGYVAQRKEDMIREKNTPQEARCPPGMRLLTDGEKAESISNLSAQKDEIEQTLAHAPLVIESQSLLRKHREMEDQLREIDNSVEQLKRKYVFVPE